jgi:hypothetical protein
VRVLVSQIERKKKKKMTTAGRYFIIIAIHVLFLLRFFAKMISSCVVFHDRIILKPNNYCAWKKFLLVAHGQQ